MTYYCGHWNFLIITQFHIILFFFVSHYFPLIHKQLCIIFFLGGCHSRSFTRGIKFLKEFFTKMKHFKISWHIDDWIILDLMLLILCLVICIFYNAHINTYVNHVLFAFFLRTCIHDSHFWFTLFRRTDILLTIFHVDPFYSLLSKYKTRKLGIFYILISELFIFWVLVICVLTGPTHILNLIIHFASCHDR